MFFKKKDEIKKPIEPKEKEVKKPIKKVYLKIKRDRQNISFTLPDNMWISKKDSKIYTADELGNVEQVEISEDI
jgi:hypothetical protein